MPASLMAVQTSTSAPHLDTERCEILQSALKQNLIGPELSSATFFDLDYFVKTLAQFQHAFNKPINSNLQYLHCFAAKSCPFPDVIKRLPALGFGVEAASLTEVEIALRNGVEAKNIVWDSPCKTVAELQYGLDLGVNMNADNAQELERIHEIWSQSVQKMEEKQRPQYLGLRVNPCVGFGDREVTSTANLYSKFGLPLSEYEDDIIAYFEKYDWLNSIHSHIGSQAFGISGLADAARIIYQLAEKINSKMGFQKVLALDLGGGLPTLYDDDNADHHFSVFDDFVEHLNKVVPEIFSGKYLLITENGRTLVTKSGWTASRIEYTKRIRDRVIMTQHVGADMFLRTCYLPTVWPLRKFLCDQTGKHKVPTDECPMAVCDVAGPLCFGGDYIGKEEKMPMPMPGDWLIICDTGGYTISMWSGYCSRPCPPIFSFTRQPQTSQSFHNSLSQPSNNNNHHPKNSHVQFEVMKTQQSIEQIIAFYT